jgi:hypothetical protein
MSEFRDKKASDLVGSGAAALAVFAPKTREFLSAYPSQFLRKPILKQYSTSRIEPCGLFPCFLPAARNGRERRHDYLHICQKSDVRREARGMRAE